MNNNRKLVLSSIALSVLAVTSAASNAAPQAQLNKAKKATTAQSSTLSFAQWRAQQKLDRTDYTDRLIITFKE